MFIRMILSVHLFVLSSEILSDVATRRVTVGDEDASQPGDRSTARPLSLGIVVAVVVMALLAMGVILIAVFFARKSRRLRTQMISVRSSSESSTALRGEFSPQVGGERRLLPNTPIAMRPNDAYGLFSNTPGPVYEVVF